MDAVISLPSVSDAFLSSAPPHVTLRRITRDNAHLLNAHLSHSHSRDPYQHSPAYFLMTGRHGLWQARYKDSTLLVALHPNVAGRFLIFPPIGADGDTLLAAMARHGADLGAAVQLARCDTPPPAGFTAVKEDVLDWRYPVHVLDTAKVVSHRGRGFQHFRTNLNRLNGQNIAAHDLDPRTDRETIAQVLHHWAAPDQHEVYDRLLDLFGHVSLAGRIITHNGQPVGFSIWEHTAPDLANAYAHIGLYDPRGTSQWVYWDMCRTLEAKGITRVCIGGSETKGLDQFKRKLCPIESIPLSSYTTTPKSPAQNQNTKPKIPHPIEPLKI